MNYELGIKGFATDISGRALLVAKRNAKLHKVNNKIKFIKSDLLKNIHNSLFIIHNSILIANLPYLPEKLNKKDLMYEPSKALYAGKDGLDLYRKLFLQIKNLEYKPKYVLLEIDPSQKNKIKKIVKNILPEYKIKIKKDLSGLNRVLILL